MRPLNRPMFRYGGPIKEGVMSGIREPHAGGGRAALVGNPVYPQTGGREHHADYWKNLWAAGKPILKSWATPWKKPKKVVQAGEKIVGNKNLQGIFVKKATSPGITGSGAGQTFMKNLKDFSFPGATKALGWAKKAKNLAFKYPKSTLVGGTYVGPKIVANVPTPKWSGSWGIKDILVPDEIYNYETGRWFNPDDKDIKPEDKKILDEKDKVTETNPWKEKYEALVEENKVPKKSDEEIRADKLQKYRDIVDIKGMNSEAAANSLIEASRLINESQDFKGDIRSGSLINKIIQGASKAYDKPADMKRAIDTLILKSEIQHDLNKEEKALANEVKRKQIEIYDKQLAGKTLNERIGEFRTKHQRNPSGNSLEGILLDIDIPVVDVADTTQVDAHIKNGGDEVSFMESIVEANVKEGKSVTPGVYVVKDKIIIIDENGKVKKKR